MILLNPGPVNVSARVTRALARGDLCHREPEFQALLESVRAKLLAAFAPDGGWVAVPITGSGTLSLEAAVSSAVTPGRKMLVVQNGVYGARMREIAETYGIPTVIVQSSWTERPDTAAIARALADDPEIEVVAMVHHETTTGLLNPVEEVGTCVRAAGRILLVDAISGLAGDPMQLDSWGVDICVGVANKCVQGLPGVGFVLVRSAEMARMEALPQRTLYCHLPRHFRAHEKRTVPFTAAVQVLYALDEALDELLEEGVAERVARYGRAAAQLRAGFSAMDLEFLLPDEVRSNSITTLRMPEGFDYGQLHDALRARDFVIYEGQGRLAKEAFRVANMGALSEEDFDRFLAALAAVLGRT